MARIPLRVYSSEIEKLIENGQTQEAIAHCKYILKSYPKYIDIYRLIGKALLESQRFTEAADILQRVLSVIPDDFISQIGMSLIREDENNLDASICHMERAYEIQPSNKAIQGEMRRLYGRRDGVEPPKIRLTRGALVRMYMRGEQYPQGIAEAKTALAEDPQRFDLQVLLARLYYLAGQKVQAAEVASSIAVALPYCYEANRILSEVLVGSRPEDAKIYQDRLKELDPYMRFISENAPTSADVPDAALQIEKLDYQPSQEEVSQPEWTRTIGVAWEDQNESEASQDWMSGENPEQKPAAAQQPADLIPVEEPAAPAEIPDWMAAAGWNVSDGKETEAPASTDFQETSEDGAIASEAEIPDWLKEMAPETPTQDEPVVGEAAEEDQGWLNNLFGEEASAPKSETPTAPVDAVAEQPSVAADETEPAQAAEMPDWLSGLGGAGAQDSMPSEPGQAPDWLTTGAAEELPDWMKTEASAAIEPAAAVENEDLPDWLQQMGEAETVDQTIPAVEASPETRIAAVEDQPQEEAVDEEVVLPEAKVEEPQATLEPSPAVEPPAAEVETPADDMDAALAWLESLAAKQGAVEGTLLVNPDERTEDMPEWLQKEAAQAESAEASIEQPSAIEETPQAVEAAAEPAAEAEEAELPEWLKGGPAGETIVEPVQSTEPEAEAEAAELPEWLSSVGTEPAETGQGMEEFTMGADAQPEETKEEPAETAWPQAVLPGEMASTPASEIPTAAAAEETPQEAELEAQPEELPDWLKEIGQPKEAQAPMERVEAVASEPKPEPAAPVASTGTTSGGEDIDAALAWLESLAAKQGAVEGTLLVNPEERTDDMPEWLQAQAETAASAEQAQPDAPAAAQPEVPAMVEEPAAENENTTQAAEVMEIVEPAAEAEAPAEISAPEAVGESAVEQMPEEQPEMTAFEEPAAEEEREKTQPVTIARKPETEAIAEEAVTAVEPSQPDAELTSEWQNESEAETAPEALPDWLQDLGNYTPAQALPEDSAPAQLDALPEWMQDAEAEPVENLDQAQSVWQPEMPAEAAQDTAPAAQAAPVEPEPEPEPEVEPEPQPAATLPETKTESQPVPAAVPVADGSALELGQHALASGDVDTALGHYNQLTQRGEHLDEVIHDLRDAIYRFPVNCDLYQTLGDAYLRSNRIQDALEAYNKAEELLR